MTTTQRARTIAEQELCQILQESGLFDYSPRTERAIDLLAHALAAAEERGRVRGIEEAAKEADRIAGDDKTFHQKYMRKAAGTLALAIRAIKAQGGMAEYDRRESILEGEFDEEPRDDA